MARTLRIEAPTAAMAMAIAEVIVAEGGWASYLPSDKGPTVLALCPMGVANRALQTFGLQTR